MLQPLNRMHLHIKMQQRILKAATSLFSRKGFAGTSVGDIAKKIKINQPLIYYYFPNKEALWRAAKEVCLANFSSDESSRIPVTTQGLRFFLERYLSSSLEYWFQHAQTLRFLCWDRLQQRVESALHSSLMVVPDALCVAMEQFQKQGAITSSITPLMAAAFLRNAAKGPFFQYVRTLDKPAERSSYISISVNYLERLLHP